MEAIKGIPYGMSNFENVITQNRYYVDKSMYIPTLEDQANYLIFTRPRRFGKSLLLSMLRAYYDFSQKDKFQQLFGNLWIGQHPTPLQGSNRKSVIKRIAEEGKIVTNLYQSFSADQITNPEIFPSLLFYYGMLTIVGARGNLTVLGIPNTNVRKQYYEYILEEV